MSLEPRRDRPAARRTVTSSLLRAAATATALVAVYYAMPFDGRLGGADIVLLPVGLCGFCVLSCYGIRGITRSDAPRIRAIQVLATILPVFMILFASTYFVMSDQDSAVF